MAYKAKNPITWRGDAWAEIIRFEIPVIELKNIEGNGISFYGLPISPAEYRQREPTLAGAAELREPWFYVFEIVDDWGGKYYLRIPIRKKDLIAQIRTELINAKLLANGKE